MWTKSIDQCDALVANDGCRIFELMHPANDDVDLPYSLAVAVLAVGEASYRHRLQQTEVYYVLDGEGVMHIDDEVQTLHAGEVVFIPAHAVQWIENSGAVPLRFIALVSPPWSERDDERL